MIWMETAAREKSINQNNETEKRQAKKATPGNIAGP